MRKPKYLNTRLMGCTKEQTKKDPLGCQTLVQLSTLKNIKETKPKKEKKNKTSKHKKTTKQNKTKKRLIKNFQNFETLDYDLYSGQLLGEWNVEREP